MRSYAGTAILHPYVQAYDYRSASVLAIYIDGSTSSRWIGAHLVRAASGGKSKGCGTRVIAGGFGFGFGLLCGAPIDPLLFALDLARVSEHQTMEPPRSQLINKPS
jgi:hypothetical protein